MRVNVILEMLDNFTPSLALRESSILYHGQNPKAAKKKKKISTCNVPEDENNLVQTRLGGKFWASDVIMDKAHCSLF